MKRILIAAVAALALITTTATPAFARSYAASSVKYTNRWAVSHFPSAYYVYSTCYGAGYQRAACRIDITKRYSACSVTVSVSGPSYRVRQYDTTC